MKLRSVLSLGALLAFASPFACGNRDAADLRVQSTAASVEVLHPDVVVTTAAGRAHPARVSARIELEGRVATGAAGRAIVRTDDGLELRLAGDTEVLFHEGHPRVERGRAFVSSWGDDERELRLGPELLLRMSDAAVEAERGRDGRARAVAVRGEVSWSAGDRQALLHQGDELAGQHTFESRPAGVWDDWTGGAASPQGAAHRGALGSGEAVLHTAPGEAPAQLAVNEHRVGVVVEGDAAITTVAQRFFNGSDQTAPVEYRVRIPEGAIVAGFAIERDGYMVRAAPGTVAQLMPQGGQGALMQSPDGGLFARLDPLAPGQSVRCTLQYVEWLHHEDGRRTYVYPMGDPVAPPFVGEFTFDLSSVRANVAALRGPAGSEVHGGERLHFARSDFRPRADLQVDLLDQTPPASPSARLWLSPQGETVGGRFVLADVTIPPAHDQGSDLIVVLDDSAATDRSTLTVASAAVDALLHVLGPDDRIALYFGDLRARPADGDAGRLAGVTDARREALLEAISRARPGGATNLSRVLAEAYAALDPRRNGSVIYLGDAMPTMGALDPERLYDQTLRVAPDLRLYAIALGNDRHPDVLEPLTSRGGLLAEARDQAEAVLAAQRIAAHATRPVLRDVTVSLGGAVAHPLPGVIEQWVAGDPLRVYGELTGPLPLDVTVDARQGTERKHFTASAAIDTIHDGGDIRRRWALARVRNLEHVGANRAALADLGARYGLITPMSALVLGANPAGATDGVTAYPVAASLWPDTGTHTRLPRLGLETEVEPRGVRAIFETPEYEMVTDDESGWQRHALSEDAGPGAGAADTYALALGAADDGARACVDRARQLRPALAGVVTVAATVAADGRVTDARVTGSTMGDMGTESCIRRAVAGLKLPDPRLFGATPGQYNHSFEFASATGGPTRRSCPPSARLARDAREVLWRERLAGNPGNAPQVWTDASFRCELRLWEDRTALLDQIVRVASDPTQLAAIRAVLDTDAAKYFERALARRWGPSRVWRAYLASQGSVNWDALLRALDAPNTPVEQRLALVQAYRLVAPQDVDLRLREMALFEQAGRRNEARRAGEALRADPLSDARVRALVGEMLIRAGDRDEGLRAFSEIAEFAPYDTGARSRLGDLLLTYGGEDWADEAYLQYQTLAALRPGDPLPRVRMALAAVRAHREDEALRILRGVAEDAGRDATTPAIEALLVTEVARLAGQNAGEDPAVRSWVRVARLLEVAQQGGVLARWTHPDVGLELRAQQAGDTGFVTVGDASAAYHLGVFSPGTALDGSRLLVRANSGLDGARSVTAHLELLDPAPGGPRLVERDVTLDARRRVVALRVQNGALLDDPTPVPADEQPPETKELY